MDNTTTTSDEKFVFELKDLSFSDLISLYNDILDFNTYLDNTFKSVSEEVIAPTEEVPSGEDESKNSSDDSSEKKEESKEEPKEENKDEVKSDNKDEGKEENA